MGSTACASKTWTPEQLRYEESLTLVDRAWQLLDEMP